MEKEINAGRDWWIVELSDIPRPEPDNDQYMSSGFGPMVTDFIEHALEWLASQGWELNGLPHMEDGDLRVHCNVSHNEGPICECQLAIPAGERVEILDQWAQAYFGATLEEVTDGRHKSGDWHGLSRSHVREVTK
jgi:hypothetical protein